jgi:hypothetical protein
LSEGRFEVGETIAGKANQRRRERLLARKMDRPQFAERVREGLADYHSPDEIAGRMKLTIADPPADLGPHDLSLPTKSLPNARPLQFEG